MIEMLISMAMGLMLIAGITSIFIADSNTSRALSSRTERMDDLFLASHLMQEALRESRKVPDPTTTIHSNLTSRGVSLPANFPSEAAFAALPYWDASSNTLTYQDMEGNVGIFQYQRTQNDRIYWLRPLPLGAKGVHTFQELMRNLDTATGMSVFDPATNLAVTAIGGGMRIDLTSAYTNENKQGKTLSLSFLMWPRN